MQQTERVQREIDETKADMKRLTAQAAISAKAAQQHARHISQLEQLAAATGMQCMHYVIFSQADLS